MNPQPYVSTFGPNEIAFKEWVAYEAARLGTSHHTIERYLSDGRTHIKGQAIIKPANIRRGPTGRAIAVTMEAVFEKGT